MAATKESPGKHQNKRNSLGTQRKIQRDSVQLESTLGWKGGVAIGFANRTEPYFSTQWEHPEKTETAVSVSFGMAHWFTSGGYPSDVQEAATQVMVIGWVAMNLGRQCWRSKTAGWEKLFLFSHGRMSGRRL